MKTGMEIRLEKVKFYSYHGLDEGEDIVGGEYEVNLITHYIPTDIPIYSIEQTIDYTALHKIVSDRMKKPTHLLETIATEIAGEIIAKFSAIYNVVISISKLHPPIPNFQGSVGVTYTLTRE